ncbi:MAG: inorganic phosphate transporter, partial [Bacteroidota bacterium]
MFELAPDLLILLILCLTAACGFEFVNGFHDTANAVATVIYTNSLKPNTAVVWSGICNFVGLMTSTVFGLGVAIGIINLLPIDMLIDQDIYHSVAMVLALLLSAIIWNLGTWYYGLPSSSSHTLIGSILGVGIAFSFMPESTGTAINWGKAREIGLSLLISPFFGFSMTILLMFLLRRFTKNTDIFKEPKKNQPPPTWIRSILVLTCTGVSFFHGMNDGQKGVGLVMLILIGIVPSYYALDTSVNPANMKSHLSSIEQTLSRIDTLHISATDKNLLKDVQSEITELRSTLSKDTLSGKIDRKSGLTIRRDILLIASQTTKLASSKEVNLSKEAISGLKKEVSGLKTFTDYAPDWVLVMISFSLGLGTMVGWKRIVKTVGEKIGKQHLTYAQGASAELVAAITIGASTGFGLPVSTTHVLSSGIAGSM